LIASARYITAISWLTYPFVYMLKGIGLGGSNATAFEQIGYSFADIVAKAVFGIVIWRIAHEKTTVMEQEGLLK
jgi:bacteriorhodopsin